MVYASWSLALSALEVLVHLDKDLTPADLVRVEIDVPDGLGVLQIGIGELPKNRSSFPAPPELQQVGDDWLINGMTPVLQVPSSVIPEEFNFLLNPLHPDAHQLKVVSTTAFSFDPRLSS